MGVGLPKACQLVRANPPFASTGFMVDSSLIGWLQLKLAPRQLKSDGVTFPVTIVQMRYYRCADHSAPAYCRRLAPRTILFNSPVEQSTAGRKGNFMKAHHFPRTLAAIGFVAAFAPALVAQNVIQLFSAVDTRASESTASFSTPVTFSTTTLNLTCSASPVQAILSGPLMNSAGNAPALMLRELCRRAATCWWTTTFSLP